MSLRTTPNLSFITPKDGDAITSLVNPFKCLTILSENKFLLISNWNLPWDNEAIPSSPTTSYLPEEADPLYPE